MKLSMKRNSDSLDSPGTQWTPGKRMALDKSSGNVKEEELNLPETLKLANSQYFFMTENQNGKVLGCGEEVHKYPEESRFVLRILNRDYFDHGKLKDFVELKMEDFEKIHSHKSEIEKKMLTFKLTRESIIDSNDLKVTVGLGAYSFNMSAKQTVEINKAGKRSSMYLETFSRMMSYLPEVTSSYSQFSIRHNEDVKIYEEIVNALAYVRNEKKSNGYIRKPKVGRKNGLLTTCIKIIEQARKVALQKEE